MQHILCSKERGKRLGALVMTLVMVFFAMTAALPAAEAVTQKDIDNLKSQAASLKEQKSDIQKKLDKLSNSKNSALDQKFLLEEKINVLREQIALSEQSIQEYGKQIDQKEEELAAAKEEEAKYYDEFCERVRSMEERGNVSYWAVLFNANSFSDLLDQINADVAEVNRQLDTENAEWAAIGADIARKQKELEEQRKQNNVQLPPTGDGWLWPLPASNLKLTSAFGYRMHPVDHVPNSHTGIDVAASTGVPIYAARGGQVIMSEYGAGANWSYGNFVVIDHGDGTTTLYAHMSSRAVSEGQMVSQGQTIGAVGDTGNTSGPHLHYEVRRNGQRTDPEAYYPNLPFIRAYNW